jgi:hypothetical protein
MALNMEVVVAGTKKIKFWIGNLDGKCNGLVSATSQKEAVSVINSITGVSVRWSVALFQKYWNEVDESSVPKAVKSKPLTLFKRRYDSCEAWRECQKVSTECGRVCGSPGQEKGVRTENNNKEAKENLKNAK